MYKVRFYKRSNNRSPISDFIESSEKSLQFKIVHQIKALQEYGLTLSNPGLRKLAGTPLWEARILGRSNTRIICAGVGSKEIVILNIFKKKTNKTPRNEIELSIKRQKEEMVRLDN